MRSTTKEKQGDRNHYQGLMCAGLHDLSQWPEALVELLPWLALWLNILIA
jgi:hypothetical protein